MDFLNLSFYVTSKVKLKNKREKIEFVINKPGKFWKLSLGNNLSEKRLDEFAQTDFWNLNIRVSPQYWMKLNGITYE